MKRQFKFRKWRKLAVLLFVIGTVITAEAAVNAKYFFLESTMYTYEEMSKDISTLEENYSGILAADSLGKTSDGRDLIHVLVGNPDVENHVLVFGSIHGREYITSQLVMRQLHDILEHIKKDATYEDSSMKRMLNDIAIHIVPMINPDGVTLSQFGIDAMNLRSTRERLYQIYEMDGAVELDDYFRTWKSNARGIDLNRNFDANWEEYYDNVGHPSSDHFKGNAIGCEKESQALIKLTKQYPFKRTISYHAQGNVIYWYFGQQGELRKKSQDFAELVSKETGYGVDADYGKLDPAGYKDWAISKMKIPSLTVEVGTGTTPVPADQFDTIWEQNKNVIPAMIYDLFEGEKL